MHSELKWSKVKRQKLDQYKKFVDYFFALNNTDNIHFKSLIIDNHKVNHRKFNDGDKEKGFYKFYYQLLYNCFGKAYYVKDNDVKFIIHPDDRTSKYPLSELKDVLNRGMSKHFQSSINPFVSIEPKKSHDSEPVQLNDIILGAIGFQKNGYHLLAGSSEGKVKLAEYIAQCAGMKTLTETTPKSKARFGIWNLKLQE